VKKITVKSPTRVDLAGGTLDLWPLYNFTGGAKTVNVAIDIYTTVEIQERNDQSIEIVSKDLNYNKMFSSLDEFLENPDTQLDLLKSQLRFWRPQKGFQLVTSSESPVGAGLGGSSSLTISLIKAFSQFTDKALCSVHDTVHLAHNIEAQVLKTPTGTQDYYPAVCGGLNILDYSFTGIAHKVLPIAGSELEKNFILVYTGKAHHSGLNNFEVLTHAVQKDPVTLRALASLKIVAEETAQAVEAKKFQLLPELFQKEYSARVQLAKAFSSPEIEKLHEVSLQAGAEAVKICGAGGGGCVLVWSPEQKRQKVVEACVKNGFKVMDAKPVAPLL